MIQPKDAGEDIFAFGWFFSGKGIRFSLEEERCVYKTFIIKPQCIPDLRIGLADGMFRQALPGEGIIILGLIADEQIDLRALSTGINPRNTVNLPFIFKVKANFSLFTDRVDNSFGLDPGFAI